MSDTIKKIKRSDRVSRTTENPPSHGDPGPTRAAQVEKLVGFKQAKFDKMLTKKNPVRQEHDPFYQPWKPYGERP